jgi:hypothetical protein
VGRQAASRVLAVTALPGGPSFRKVLLRFKYRLKNGVLFAGAIKFIRNPMCFLFYRKRKENRIPDKFCAIKAFLKPLQNDSAKFSGMTESSLLRL